MDFLNNFAGNMASTLVCGVIKQARYSCCINNFLEEHQNEKGNLLTTRESVLKRAGEAKRQTKETDGVVNKWLDDANTLIHKAEKLEAKLNTKMSCCSWHGPNLIRRYLLAKQLAKQKSTIVTHNEKATQFIRFEHSATFPGMEYFSSENFICFESTKMAFDQLLEALKDDEVTMIGLYGMGGSGKTTLAKQVGKEAEKLFDKVVLATVSNTIDIHTIQGKLADFLSLIFEEEDISGRAGRLWSRLNGEERILIILDDVWEKLDLEAIGIPSSLVNCKILLTTRRQQVCTLMDCQRTIPLQLLEEEEAWTLFKHYARITDKTSVAVRHYAGQISRKCEGLPVAIVAVASSLKGETEAEWKEAWETIRNSIPLDVKDGLQNPYTCLQLSYDKLKDERAKLLFLLCSVFPEDFDIPMELLVIFVKGLDLFDKIDSYASIRDQVTVAKNKLIDSFLLLHEQSYAGENVKMHDIVRDVALWIAKKEFKLVLGFGRNQYAFTKGATGKDGSIKYLCCEAFPSHLDYPKLEFLFVSTDLDHVAVPEAFFKGLTELRVLALENKGKKKQLLTKPLIQTLTNLRCLHLYGCKLSEACFSFIGSLERLESLRLSNCSYDLEEKCERNVPSEVMGRYARLKNLEELIGTNCWGFKSIAFVGKPHLFNLKVIRLERCIPLETVFTTAIAQSLKQLEELQITGCLFLQYIFGQDNDQIQNEFPIELPTLKVLRLVELPNLISICPENYYLTCPSLPDFYLSRCPKFTGMRQVHSSKLTAGLPIEIMSFKNLVKLEIFHCNIRYIFSAYTAESLPLLEELDVEECWNLEELFMNKEYQNVLNSHMESCKVDDYSEGTSSSFAPVVDCQHPHQLNSGSLNLCNLKRLTLTFCSRLRSLFAPSIAKILSSLEELKIVSCPSLIEIITHETALEYKREEVNQDDHSFLHDVSIFPRMKDLMIAGCPLLQCVFTIPFARGLVELKSIKVFDTPKLEYVFGKSSHEHHSSHQCQNKAPVNLPALEVLVLEHIPALTSIFANNSYGTCPSLRKLSLKAVQFSSLSSINIMVGSNAIHSDSSFPKELGAVITVMQNLESLAIRNNDKMEGIFDLEELSIDDQRVRSRLTTLSLHNLSELRYIWMGAKHITSLQNLKKLTIWGCAKLNTIFSVPILRSLPLLKVLVIMKCKKLVQITEEDKEYRNVATPQSQQLCFPLKAKKPKKEGQVCFPQLKVLAVGQCNKLKHLLSFSTFQEFPKLEQLIIFGASKMEKVFAGEQGVAQEGDNVMLRRLKHLIVMNLPMLSNIWPGSDDREFQNVTYRVVQNCPKLSLTSTTTLEDFKTNYHDKLQHIYTDGDTRLKLVRIVRTVIEEATKGGPISSPRTIFESHSPPSIPIHAMPSQDLVDEQQPSTSKPILLDQRQTLLGETKSTIEVITKEPASEEAMRSASSRPLVTPLQEAFPLGLMKKEPSSETIMTEQQGVAEMVEQSLPTEKAEIVADLELVSTWLEPSSSSMHNKSPQLLVLTQNGENKNTNETPCKPSVTAQKDTEPENDSASEARLKKFAMANSMSIAQLESSSLYPSGASLDNTTTQILLINPTPNPFGSTSMSSRKLLAELSGRGGVERFTPRTETSDSNLIIVGPNLLQELKDKLEGYLDMSVEAIWEANAFDTVEEIVHSLAQGTTDMIQKNILEDFTSRLESFKECVPKAMGTLKSSIEFKSNYENLIVEWNTKLNEGHEKLRDLESKLSKACADEYALDIEIQKLINQKIELLAEKNSLAFHLHQTTQAFSKDYEEWKALGNKLKLSTDQWLKSKEVLAHANASWKLFKESLRL